MPEQPDTARKVVSRWLADYTGWWQPESADHVASDEFGAAADNLLAALDRARPEQPNDLVTALRKTLESAGYFVEPYVAHDLARAVLARTNLVLPASAVLDLAAKWDAQYATGSRGAMFGDLYAAELRALVAGGES